MRGRGVSTGHGAQAHASGAPPFPAIAARTAPWLEPGLRLCWPMLDPEHVAPALGSVVRPGLLGRRAAGRSFSRRVVAHVGRWPGPGAGDSLSEDTEFTSERVLGRRSPKFTQQQKSWTEAKRAPCKLRLS